MVDTLKTSDIKKLCEMISNFGGIDVVGINVGLICNWTDYLIISTFSSFKQIEALYSDVILKFLELVQIEVYFNNKIFNSDWTLISFNNAVIHLLNDKSREYYELDKIWENGEVVYS